MSRLLEKLNSLKKTFHKDPKRGVQEVGTSASGARKSSDATLRRSPPRTALWALFAVMLGAASFFAFRKPAPQPVDPLDALKTKLNEALSSLKKPSVSPAVVKNWGELVELLPGDAYAEANHALAVKRSGDRDLSRRLLSDLLLKYPDFALAHHNLGMLDLDAGLHQSAIAHMKRAVELEPNSFEMRVNLGRAQETSGDFAAALLTYQGSEDFAQGAAKSALGERIRRLTSLALRQREGRSLANQRGTNSFRDPASEIDPDEVEAE